MTYSLQISTYNWGHTSREREKSVGGAISELTIIRKKLQHPNVVRYHKTFVESKSIYQTRLIIFSNE